MQCLRKKVRQTSDAIKEPFRAKGDMSILQTGKDINMKRKICQSIKTLSGNKRQIFPRFQLYAGCMYVWTLRFCNHVKRAMLHGAIRNDNFSATRRCKIVATVFRNVTSLF